MGELTGRVDVINEGIVRIQTAGKSYKEIVDGLIGCL